MSEIHWMADGNFELEYDARSKAWRIRRTQGTLDAYDQPVHEMWSMGNTPDEALNYYIEEENERHDALARIQDEELEWIVEWLNSAWQYSPSLFRAAEEYVERTNDQRVMGEQREAELARASTNKKAMKKAATKTKKKK